ncbi:hypothetical protein N7478_009876 [Penicillium angulare]|uniref:uncharacterized protein n=1 Tax=Penicillium angulare TaxID=116970 RepID=UPI0025422FD0|nr:uncharacterized protein N7478_009876 [Penicillium angulare]KAJ5267068.1 hypothetical protein N7478_009876 [Penicillium angulare]
MSCALELLPSEILDQIIFFLITEPPSLGRHNRRPDRHIAQSKNRDLKNLVQCSRRLLYVVRPRLFTHACVDLKDECGFKDFILASDLARHVQSLVVISEESLIHPLIQPWWHRTFSFIDPTRVTVHAPPLFIGNTLDIPIVDADDEAFDIHLQALQLEREGTPSVTNSLPLENCKNLLLARPWTSMSINESSFMKSYSNDEYFLLQAPSIFKWWSKQAIPESPSPQISTMIYGITSFSYTAVLPSYNHVKLMLDSLSAMPGLQFLSVQLASDTDDQVQQIRWPGGTNYNFHVSWGEFATAYSLIIYEVVHKQSLTEFQSRDCALEVIPADLTSGLDVDLKKENWALQGAGLWRRRK